MTSSMVGRKSPKALPKGKLAPKKGHGHYLVVYCWPDPLQLSESWWNHYIWEVCSANVWNTPKTATPVAGISQQKRVKCLWQCLTKHQITNASKIEWIGLWSFASTTIFTWPPANHLPFLQASQQYFARKKLPKPVEGRKCFPKIHQIPKHGFLCYRNKETYFLLQKYVDYNGSYFD